MGRPRVSKAQRLESFKVYLPPNVRKKVKSIGGSAFVRELVLQARALSGEKLTASEALQLQYQVRRLQNALLASGAHGETAKDFQLERARKHGIPLKEEIAIQAAWELREQTAAVLAGELVRMGKDYRRRLPRPLRHRKVMVPVGGECGREIICAQHAAPSFCNRRGRHSLHVCADCGALQGSVHS